MADSEVPDTTTNDDTSDKPKSKYDKVKILLYIAMGLSAWGDRMWQFAVGIYFISLNPANLQSVAINGIVLNLAAILFGTAIGDWIDRNERLPALRKALFFQNSSVTIMAGLVVIALYYQSYFPAYWMLIIQGFLIALGVVASLSSAACKVSISKDWIVALYGSDRQNLARTNATLRRIDLISNVLAPVLTGAIMAFTSRWISALVIAGWNVVSLIFELLLYTSVHKYAHDLLANKLLARKPDEQPTKKQGSMRKLFSSVQGLGTYKSLSVFFPGLSLALLYMTVLSFDSVTRAYVIEEGLSEALLGVLNGLGSVVGIIGTFVYPVLVKHVGLVGSGVIGFWSEFAMLILCLLSLFVNGTSFVLLENTSMISCHYLNSLSNNNATTSTLNRIVHSCSNSKLSVLLLVSGITLNRFGLWLADLTVHQLLQERVPEKIRGRIGGTQHSLNQFFDLLRYVFIVCLPRLSQFGYHICLSVLSVFTASLIYSIWSCSSASDLVPPAADIEMTEKNADLAKHYEDELGEELDYVDEENKA